MGWLKNLVGSESGQKQSVKFLQNMVYSTIHPPPPPRHTLSVHTVHLVWEGGEVREKIEGNSTQVYCSSFVHGGNSSQAGSKIPTNEWMYLQSIKSVKHNAANSVNRSILKKSRHIGFGVFVVHSSMSLPHASTAWKRSRRLSTPFADKKSVIVRTTSPLDLFDSLWCDCSTYTRLCTHVWHVKFSKHLGTERVKLSFLWVTPLFIGGECLESTQGHLKGLSHEMDLAFDDMYGLVLGLNRGRGHF
jgi:hypothetical protein